MKLMADGPLLHAVASIGAVRLPVAMDKQD